MKKILLSVIALGSLLTANAQVLFNEDFDGISGPTAGGAGTYVFPSGWTLANVDNSTPSSTVSYVNQAWTRREDFKFNVADSAVFSTSFYSPAGAADDWMVTPAIGPLPANVELSWNAVAYDPAYPDGYEVRIMTTAPTGSTGNLGNLVTASTVVFSTAAEASAWTAHTVSLNAYAGQTVYVAFRNNSNDKFVLLIDDVKLAVAINNDAKLVSLDTVPEYTSIPKNQVYNMPTLATINNAGINTLNNVALKLNVYNGAMSQIYTNTGTPAATLAPGANVQLSAGSYMLPSTPDTYYFEYIVTHSVADDNTLNDTLYNSVVVSDSVYARDNGTVTASLGIGAGVVGYMGQSFTLNNSASLSSVTFYVTRGYVGKKAACALWDMSGGMPNAIIATSDTMLYPDDSARIYTLAIHGGPQVLAPGSYALTQIEFDSTLALGQTNSIFRPGTTWVYWSSSPLGTWGNNEDFGASFSKPYVLRMNLNPDCTGFSAGASSTSASCGTCADGTATVTVVGGTSPSYSWAPSGGSAATATGLLPGTYTVTVSDVSGCSTTATTTVNFSTNIVSAELDAATSIYPNPGKDLFTVTIPEALGNTVELKVTNYLGQVVFVKSITGFGKKELNLSSLASGKYNVTLTGTNNVVNKQISILK